MPDIVLKDRSETKHTYEGIEKVQLNTADGGTQIFSAGEVIESIPITLDLREGNQTVEAPEGYLVKSAVIQKPEALKPENIKEGETIAGVEGNLFVPAVVSTTVALDFSEGDMVVTPEDGTAFSEVNIPKPKNLTKDKIKHGVRIAGIDGEFIGDTEEKTIDGTNDLTFADGDFVVTPSEETKVISKVTITPPEALRAENIKKGETIAGVEGNLSAPQLYPPSSGGFISSEKPSHIYVENPYTKNGLFPRKVQILALSNGTQDYVVVTEVAFSGNTHEGMIYIYASDFNEPLPLSNPIARFVADNFQDSEVYNKSSSTYSLYKLVYDLLNVTTTNSGALAFSSDSQSGTLTPSDTYYLPKNIEVAALDWSGNTVDYTDYTYDPDSGSIVVNGSANQNVTVKVHGTQTPWLRNPQISVSDDLVATVDYIDINAESTNLLCNGEVITTVADDTQGLVGFTPTLKTAAANYQTNYGFANYGTTGYAFKSSLSNVAKAFSLMRVDFNMKTEATIQIYVYANITSASYDTSWVATVSKVDCELVGTYDRDDTSLILWDSYNCNAEYKTTTLNVTIPAGKHFMYFKFANSSSTYTANFYLQFEIKTLVAEKNTYYLPDCTDVFGGYGQYSLQAQSFADGYDSSDIVDIGEISYNPIVDLTDNTLLVTNDIPSNITAFEIYFDGELKDTIDYDGSGSWSVDLTPYEPDETITHDVHVVGIGSNVTENHSNTILFYPPPPYYSVASAGASYTFTLNSSTGYYVSNNKGKNSSCALCKVTFNTQGGHLYLDCISYGESNYDYGILSTIDVDNALSTTSSADTTNVFKSFKGLSSSSVQTVDYGEIAAGEHFIYVKYRKDSSGNSGNDTLQFKVRFE